ncbi:hypothetical protein [Methylobacterium komagatae]
MSNKHFVQAPSHPKAFLRMGSYDVPCSVLSSDENAVRVRVMTAGGHFGEVTFVRDGDVRSARITLRKQGPLGLDLWLELEPIEAVRAA